jgi:hypothetical protein
MLELKDPTVEQVQELISSLAEIPMNKTFLCLKQMNEKEEAEAAGMSINLSAAKLLESERAMLRPMYVLAASHDAEPTIQVLDRVRASRITEVTGVQIPCTIRGYKVVIIRDFDVLTVIKNEA